MSKSKWIPGLPKEPGIYWYDSGFRFGQKDDRHPGIIQVSKDTYSVWGDFGNFYLNTKIEKLYDNVKYMPIELPSYWQNHSAVTKSRSRAWVKTPKERLGFALLTTVQHNGISSTIFWINEDPTEVHVGSFITPDDEYEFCLIDSPILK